MKWSQILETGVSDRTVRRWRRDHYLHRVLPGVYAVGHAARSTEADLTAALLYAGPGAMLSHATALWWYGLLEHQPDVIQVSTPRRLESLAGIEVHPRRHLPRHVHRDLPLTSPSQALLDFAAGDPPRERLRFVLANAEYHGRVDLEALTRITGRGIPGSAVLNDALRHHRPELARTRSDGERLLLAICEDSGLPLPESNVHLRGWLVDAVWPDHHLVVEIDGLHAHRTPAQLQRDHQRDLELRRSGYTVLRYTWRQLRDQPEAVAAELADHLGPGTEDR